MKFFFKINFLTAIWLGFMASAALADSPAGKGIICSSSDGRIIGIEFYQHVETREKKADIFGYSD